MQEELERALQVVTKEIKAGISADDALKLSQAAFNLANCLGGLKVNEILV